MTAPRPLTAAPGWATGYAAGQAAERERVKALADERDVEYLATGTWLDGAPMTWHPFSALIEQTAPEET